MRALDSGRIGISGQALGIAQAAVDESRAEFCHAPLSVEDA
jgi:alkylation response protein AidB-like acyl-CoA dehydrogenase